jgi:hypothetical protein
MAFILPFAGFETSVNLIGNWLYGAAMSDRLSDQERRVCPAKSSSSSWICCVGNASTTWTSRRISRSTSSSLTDPYVMMVRMRQSGI